MRRLWTVVVILAISGRAAAQDDHGPEPNLTEHLVGGKLIGWQVEGDSVADKDSITIGGKSQAKVKLLTPIGDRFSLRLEFQYAGPTAPLLQWKTNQISNWNLSSAGPNRWMEFSVSGAQGTWRSGAHWRQTTRAIDGSYNSSGGMYFGPGPLREFHIVVPANTTLTLRRIASHTTPVTQRSPYGIIIAIAVLVGVLLGLMALGWFLNRRRSVAGTRPAVSE